MSASWSDNDDDEEIVKPKGIVKKGTMLFSDFADTKITTATENDKHEVSKEDLQSQPISSRSCINHHSNELFENLSESRVAMEEFRHSCYDVWSLLMNVGGQEQALSMFKANEEIQLKAAVSALDAHTMATTQLDRRQHRNNSNDSTNTSGSENTTTTTTTTTTASHFGSSGIGSGAANVPVDAFNDAFTQELQQRASLLLGSITNIHCQVLGREWATENFNGRSAATGLQEDALSASLAMNWKAKQAAKKEEEGGGESDDPFNNEIADAQQDEATGGARQFLSDSSFVDTASDLVYVRVWKSRKQGRKFQQAFQCLEQTRQSIMLPPAFAVPFSVSLAYQGKFVTVSWLVPLMETEPVSVTDGGVVSSVERCWRCALGLLPQSAKLPLYYGADGRYYSICVKEALANKMPNVEKLSTMSSDIQRVEFAALDVLEEEFRQQQQQQIGSNRLVTTSSGSMGGSSTPATSPRRADGGSNSMSSFLPADEVNAHVRNALYQRVLHCIRRWLIDYDSTFPTTDNIDAKLFSKLLKSSGLNMHFLYDVRTLILERFHPSGTEKTVVGSTSDLRALLLPAEEGNVEGGGNSSVPALKCDLRAKERLLQLIDEEMLARTVLSMTRAAVRLTTNALIDSHKHSIDAERDAMSPEELLEMAAQHKEEQIEFYNDLEAAGGVATPGVYLPGYFTPDMQEEYEQASLASSNQVLSALKASFKAQKAVTAIQSKYIDDLLVGATSNSSCDNRSWMQFADGLDDRAKPGYLREMSDALNDTLMAMTLPQDEVAINPLPSSEFMEEASKDQDQQLRLQRSHPYLYYDVQVMSVLRSKYVTAPDFTIPLYASNIPDWAARSALDKNKPPVEEFGSERISLDNIGFFVGDRLGLVYDMDEQRFVSFGDPVALSHTGRPMLGREFSATTRPLSGGYLELVTRWTALLEYASKIAFDPNQHANSVSSSATSGMLSMRPKTGDGMGRHGSFLWPAVQTVCACMAISALDDAAIQGELTSSEEYLTSINTILRLRIPPYISSPASRYKALLKEPEFALPFVVLGGHCPSQPAIAEKELQLLSAQSDLVFGDVAYIANRSQYISNKFQPQLQQDASASTFTMNNRARLLKVWSGALVLGHEIFEKEPLWHVRRVCEGFISFVTLPSQIDRVVTNLDFLELRKDITCALVICSGVGGNKAIDRRASERELGNEAAAQVRQKRRSTIASQGLGLGDMLTRNSDAVAAAAKWASERAQSKATVQIAGMLTLIHFDDMFSQDGDISNQLAQRLITLIQRLMSNSASCSVAMALSVLAGYHLGLIDPEDEYGGDNKDSDQEDEDTLVAKMEDIRYLFDGIDDSQTISDDLWTMGENNVMKIINLRNALEERADNVNGTLAQIAFKLSEALTMFLDEVNEDEKEDRRKLLDYGDIFKEVRRLAERTVQKDAAAAAAKKKKTMVSFVDTFTTNSAEDGGSESNGMEEEEDDGDDLKTGFVTRGAAAMEISMRTPQSRQATPPLNQSASFGASVHSISRPVSRSRPSSQLGRLGIATLSQEQPIQPISQPTSDDDHESSKLDMDFSFPRDDPSISEAQEHNAALKIQSAHRQRQARLEVDKRRAVIQAEADLAAAEAEERAVRAAADTNAEQSNAALKIQSAHRQRQARLEVDKRRAVIQAEADLAAAEAEERAVRAAADTNAEQSNAALKIQSAHRQRQARLEVDKRRAVIQAEADLVAAEAEERAVRAAAAAEVEELNGVALMIQSAHRKRQARAAGVAKRAAAEEASKLAVVNEQNRAALRIQCAHRQRLARQEVFKRRNDRALVSTAVHHPGDVTHCPSPPARVPSASLDTRYNRFISRAESCPANSALVVQEPSYLLTTHKYTSAGRQPVPPRLGRGVPGSMNSYESRIGIARNTGTMIGKLAAFNSGMEHRRLVRGSGRSSSTISGGGGTTASSSLPPIRDSYRETQSSAVSHSQLRPLPPPPTSLSAREYQAKGSLRTSSSLPPI